ncbi:MAG: formylglycine-generating enzyme family protein, partial [Deltaproteobacteria bacterium]|nr:formylglycine-generating enzyme family protein [Deltaproteobacteria bacterium]
MAAFFIVEETSMFEQAARTTTRTIPTALHRLMDRPRVRAAFSARTTGTSSARQNPMRVFLPQWRFRCNWFPRLDPAGLPRGVLLPGRGRSAAQGPRLPAYPGGPAQPHRGPGPVGSASPASPFDAILASTTSWGPGSADTCFGGGAMGRVASCWAVAALGMALLAAMSGCGGTESEPGMETQCTAGEACDDENPCTENDKCTGQGECIGELISCDDSRECTVDSCDPSGQCVHDLKPGFCLINGVCVADGETKPDTPCAECMVAASKTEWMNDDTNECGLEDKCHTGSHCSDGECILGTEALDCDDDNSCTDDSCDPAKGCQSVPNSSPCEHGTCVDGECQCTPDCDGKECGPDGCGSDCGTCDEGCECNEGFCATSCPTSACEPPSDDTPAETVCNGNKVMVCEQVPNCAPGVGLFGEPQDCPTGMACLGFDCACEFKSCGDEEVFECCPSNQHTCVGSQCCLPVCEGKECGPDGCGGTCGSCGADSTCDENSGKCFSVPDGMVLVPAGKFWMGCHEAIDSECLDDEYPYHEVELNAFFVDKTEVF